MKFRRVLVQLQQRKVTRVAAIYAAAAWALLQVADVMFPIVGLGENAITMVLVLALVGFPLSLISSWIFDITSEGIKQTSDAEMDSSVERIRLTPIRLTVIFASTALFILVGYLYMERLYENRLSLFADETAPLVLPVVDTGKEYSFEDNGRPSIAVMPFVNFSDVADLEYFGDGLAEEILNLLAKLNELNVAARTSSFYFKDKDFDIRTIARHLGVRYVLEGSVRHSGGRIRVTAQLIEASNGYHVWSETYDHDPSNIFGIQDDIGMEVVKSLQLLLSTESQNLLAHKFSVDPDAYDFYLRGRDYLRKPVDKSSMHSAEEMFRRSIEMSPDYADAHAGLCDTLLKQYFMNYDKERFQAAEHACQSAQARDSNSSAVHIALGNLYRESGQFTLAEREFNRALSLKSTAVDAYVGLAKAFLAQEKYTLTEQTLIRALELEPNNWASSMAMGQYLLILGRAEESVEYFMRINELLPESNVASNALGSAYFLMGQFEKAAVAWQEALSGAPTAALYANLGSSYFFLGRYDEAVLTYQKALELAPEDFENWGNLADAYRHSPTQANLSTAAYEKATTLARQHLQINPSDALALALLGHYLACIGNRDEALEAINLAQELAQKDMMVYYFSATALCALNEQGQALEAIGSALALGYPQHMVETDAGLSSLKALPAYEKVVRQSSPDDTQITDGDTQ